MAVLPTGGPNIGAATYESQPGLTWKINREKGRIEGTCDNWAAVRQAVEIILWTQRFLWQIYRPYTGMDYRNLVGLDAGYVGVELKRRLLDALLVDDRVTGIENYSYTVDGGILHSVFTVTTVYGGIEESVEVQV